MATAKKTETETIIHEVAEVVTTPDSTDLTGDLEGTAVTETNADGTPKVNEAWRDKMLDEGYTVLNDGRVIITWMDKWKVTSRMFAFVAVGMYIIIMIHALVSTFVSGVTVVMPIDPVIIATASDVFLWAMFLYVGNSLGGKALDMYAQIKGVSATSKE